MNSSFLYHAWGLYSLECTREEYKGNTIILHVQSKKRQKECPKCGKCNLIKNGYRTRDFLGFTICNTNRCKFLHLSTDFLNNNNSDITGTMSFLSDKHS